MDFTIHPIHQFMEHVLKGNINFFEVLYPSNPHFLLAHDEIDPIFDIARTMIPINPKFAYNLAHEIGVESSWVVIKSVRVSFDWTTGVQYRRKGLLIRKNAIPLTSA